MTVVGFETKPGVIETEAVSACQNNQRQQLAVPARLTPGKSLSG